jgi:bifunctional non-homologous end joining protein LigD
MTLEEYRKKRDFQATTEPEGAGKPKRSVGKIFVVQEHHASHLHYDLRLERDGVLVSFAVPKGIPGKPGEKHLAVRTEDHPLEYADFEGTIPEGEYGAGQVMIWDRGLYEPLEWKDDKIEVVMKGDRLAGRYVLVKFKRAGKDEWLLFRAKD